jgi:1-aminocyclopropane-1-carboxylate deaminase
MPVTQALQRLLQRDLITTPLPGWQPASSVSAIDVLRLDQLDPQLSGNKAFKLFGHVQQAERQGMTRLLSFGGPFSNHLHALAALGARCGMETIGVVRGYVDLPLTPTLQDCRDLGMTLIFADKKTYARRYDPEYRQQLAAEHGAFVIGEGGSGGEDTEGNGSGEDEGAYGQVGCRWLVDGCRGYDQVWLALGTGTTALGLARALAGTRQTPSQTARLPMIVGVIVVADQGQRRRDWQRWMPNSRWRLLDDYHYGGFGKCPAELMQLIARYDALGLPLDPVYTAKLVSAFEHQYPLDPALSEQRVLLVHSGGLQGRRGYGLSFP